MSFQSPKVKYLTNREFLSAIHESKCTFCEFDHVKYNMYDLIVQDLSTVTPDVLQAAREKKLENLKQEARKAAKSKTFESDLTLTDVPLNEVVVRVMTYAHIPINTQIEPHKIKTTADRHMKVNFPPFQHFVWESDAWRCVGRSHWHKGEFSTTHGRMTNRLGAMFMTLADRYGTRGNWRGYCVTDQAQALTQRGWLGMDDITTQDIILSYKQGELTWSKIHSVYRGEYEGLMHRVQGTGMDYLVTPGHKLLTQRGLIPVEMLLESDRLILMGAAESGASEAKYSDAFVELMGWIVTEGCYEWGKKGTIKNITIYQNPGAHADRIRSCLRQLNYTYTEQANDKGQLSWRIWKSSSMEIVKTLPTKNLTMPFILDLTQPQRHLLLETLIDGLGWRTNNLKRYTQKDAHHVSLFQALCALLGHRSRAHVVNHVAFGKPGQIHRVHVFSTRKNTSPMRCVHLHGGKNNNRAHVGKGKHLHPNVPTVPYKGRVWCPETEYGSFVMKQDNQVFITGNSYVEEMKAQAVVQLAQVGLQFDESRSLNPFSWATQVVYTSFLKVLHTEKKSQSIRDDLLIMSGNSPSHTRQLEDQLAQRKLMDESAVTPQDPDKEV
jgi:hypothetical protein